MLRLDDCSIIPKECLREDWRLLMQIIQNNNIKCFYHYTHKDNYPLIKSCGMIYSWQQCQIEKIKIPHPGGNEISRKQDIANNLSDYVHLNIGKKSLMFEQKKDILEIKIDPRVIYYIGTKFSNRNAADKNVKICDSPSFFSKLQFDLILDYRNSLNKSEYKPYQSEVLILGSVPDKFFIDK